MEKEEKIIARFGLFLSLLVFLASCSNDLLHVSSKHGHPETFHSFFKRFNSDSVFQISRVEFPLDYYSIDWELDDYSMRNDPIDSLNYTRFDFTYNDSLAKPENGGFTREFDLKKDSCKVLFLGVDNGIHEEYLFVRKNGDWFFVSATDAST